MGVPNVTFTWKSIKVLRAIVSTMSVIGLIVSFAGIVWAIRLRRDIGDYLNFVVPGDGHLWPTVIIVAVVPCAPVYILGLKAYLCLRLATPGRYLQEKEKMKDERNSNHSSRGYNDNEEEYDEDNDDEKSIGYETNRVLFLHAILCLLSGCLVTAINVACFLKSSTFQGKIPEDGLIEVMENYANDDVARSHVDTVQMEFQCCGNEDYRDWFRVSWTEQSTEYFDYVEDERRLEAENNEDGGTLVKDVPFSCCTNKIAEPCGRHEILKASTACNFDPGNERTVWNIGCRSIVLTHARVLGFFLTSFLIFLAFCQLVLFVLSRFLQTAHSNAFYMGPDMDYYRGWIVGRMSIPCTRCHGNISQDSDEETLETQSPIKETSDSPVVYSNTRENDPDNWKASARQGHEFLLTPRGSVRLVQVDRIRKSKSNPVFFHNGIANERFRRSKVKLEHYRLLPTDEPNGERSRSDKKISIERSFKSIRTSSKSRERLPSKRSIVPSAPVPPPFPPQSDEYEEERNLNSETFKINESSSTKLRVVNKEGKEDKLTKESTSKPSRQNRRKLLEKFEQILRTDEKCRRESGGADVPRPWEQLVQRSIDSPERTNRSLYEKLTSPCRKTTENCNLASRFRSNDAYDRFRGTLQDALSRRENPAESSKRATFARCAKHKGNFSRPPTGCLVQRTSHSYPVDPEDPGIKVRRRTLLPDIPCPPAPPLPPPLPPPVPQLYTNPPTSPCYPRPTLIRQQQREQRRQRRWNHRRHSFTSDQPAPPPPWTVPATFARPSTTSNGNPDDDRRICSCCHATRPPLASNEGFPIYCNDTSLRNYRRLAD